MMVAVQRFVGAGLEKNVRIGERIMTWDEFRDSYCKRHHVRECSDGCGELIHRCYLASATPIDQRPLCTFKTCPAVHSPND